MDYPLPTEGERFNYKNGRRLAAMRSYRARTRGQVTPNSKTIRQILDSDTAIPITEGSYTDGPFVRFEDTVCPTIFPKDG